MPNVTTDWSARDGSGPQTLVESHMVKPGELVYFRKPGVSIINLGMREAGVWLLGKGVITADVPIARSVMTKTDADLIARTVLPKKYVKGCGGLKLIRKCPCQYGVCGHCGAGQHDKCTVRVGFAGDPAVHPLAYLAGYPVVDAAGKPCRGFCPCTECAARPSVRKAAYRRVSDGVMRTGDTVWLVPKTLTAPAVCWKRPRATVVSVNSHEAYAVVQVDGIEHRVHHDNIRFSDPDEPRIRKPAARAPRPRPAMPTGYEEQSLF